MCLHYLFYFIYLKLLISNQDVTLGAILDPLMKFEVIQFCYSKINPFTYEEKINVLKDNMYKLFEEYVKLNPNK